MNLYKIPTHVDSPRVINTIVEIPIGETAKYEYNPTLELFKLDRCLMSAMVYPANYGFIPSTLAEDGDPLDVIIYNCTPIARGTMVECKVLGCLDMQDADVNDYKILACPVSHVKDYNRLDDVDQTWLTVAENFFQHYKELDGKKVSTHGWLRREASYDIINQSKIII